MSILPLVVVFDLDYTLWPFWVDTHVTPPFSKHKSGKVVDATGKVIKYYEDSPKILEKLQKDGVQIAVASRTTEISGANRLLQLFDWDKYISYKQIYPGSKIPHFQKIKKESGVDYSQMIFFDDERRNIKDVGSLGVFCVLVENGMNLKLLENSLKEFQQKGKNYHTNFRNEL